MREATSKIGFWQLLDALRVTHEPEHLQFEHDVRHGYAPTDLVKCVPEPGEITVIR